MKEIPKSMIDHLYINGASFAKDDNMIDQAVPHFADHVAKHYGWQLTNAADSACNRRIIRRTIKDSQEFDSNTLVVVGLTILSRTEMNVYDLWDRTDPDMIREDFFQMIRHNSPDSIYRNYRDAWFKNYSEYGEFVNLATDVLMLTGYLQSRGIPYLIYTYESLLWTPELVGPLEKLPVVQALSRDARVLNLLNDNLVSHLGPGNWYYDGETTGHLHAQGHVHAGEVLIELINSTYKCN